MRAQKKTLYPAYDSPAGNFGGKAAGDGVTAGTQGHDGTVYEVVGMGASWPSRESDSWGRALRGQRKESLHLNWVLVRLKAHGIGKPLTELVEVLL